MAKGYKNEMSLVKSNEPIGNKWKGKEKEKRDY